MDVGFHPQVVLLNLKILHNIQDVHVLPPDVVKQIFGNIEVIFDFHVETLLPRLKALVRDWLVI